MTYTDWMICRGFNRVLPELDAATLARAWIYAAEQGWIAPGAFTDGVDARLDHAMDMLRARVVLGKLLHHPDSTTSDPEAHETMLRAAQLIPARWREILTIDDWCEKQGLLP